MSTRGKVEEFLRQASFNLLDAVQENIFVTDAEGLIVYCNGAAESNTGYSLSELVGRNIDVLYRDKALSEAILAGIKGDGEARSYEAAILDKGGREHLLAVKKSPLADRDGHLIGFIAISRDVTDERLYEEELRAMKEFNEAVLNSARDMITVTDVDGMITYFNPAAEAITGFRKEEVLGRNISMFYRNADLAADQMTAMIDRGSPTEYEAVIVDKAGREHVFWINKAPLYDDRGDLIGFTGTSRDITELRQHEEEIRQLKEFNEAILWSVHDLVVVTDMEGRITYYNPMAEQVTGYTFDEIKGRHISEFYKDQSFSDEKLDFIRTTGEANSYQAVIVTKTGEERTLAVNKAPLYNAKGDLIGLAAVSRDITRRQRAEERVCELQDLLANNTLVGVESELIQTRVSQIMAPVTPACRPEDPIATAAEQIIQRNLPGIPVVGPAQDVVGVLTMKDLVEKGLFQGVDLGLPVRALMRPVYPSIEPDTFFFDALTAMVQGGVQMLLVTEGKHLRGVLTMNDLMRSRGVSIISVLERIDEQTSVADLCRFRPEVDRILQSLIVDGALASQVTSIITEFNDRITRRVIALCEQRVGPPPVPYAWLGLGSEGRKEQTLTTDQDNALIYENPPEDDEQVKAYFIRLADEIVSSLDRCGFQPCIGQIMANNPKWSGSLDGWLQRIQLWVADPTPRRARDIATFLDFRGLYGRRALVEELKTRTVRIFSNNPHFLTPVAEDALSKAPPLGLFRGFVVEKSGEHKGMLNLKTLGTLVLIDCLRLLAVKRGLYETNSLERLSGLTSLGVFTREESDSIREAYQTLMGLRLLNHLKAIQEHQAPSNHIAPDLLPRWRQQRLRDAFEIASDLQKRVRKDFWWLK